MKIIKELEETVVNQILDLIGGKGKRLNLIQFHKVEDENQTEYRISFDDGSYMIVRLVY